MCNEKTRITIIKRKKKLKYIIIFNVPVFFHIEPLLLQVVPWLNNTPQLIIAWNWNADNTQWRYVIPWQRSSRNIFAYINAIRYVLSVFHCLIFLILFCTTWLLNSNLKRHLKHIWFDDFKHNRKILYLIQF